MSIYSDFGVEHFILAAVELAYSENIDIFPT